MHKERLEKLADHLERGKLFHEVFDFRVINATDGKSDLSGSCGTAGCALGECPGLWPDDWEWDEWGSVGLKDCGSLFAPEQVFFGLNAYEAGHLFYPMLQEPDFYGGKELSGDATRHEVAANIRAFITKMEGPDAPQIIVKKASCEPVED